MTFTSSSTVENFLKMAGDDGRKLLEKAAVFSIGPQTTATAEAPRAHRGGPSLTGSTLEGLVEAMVNYFVEKPD